MSKNVWTPPYRSLLAMIANSTEQLSPSALKFYHQVEEGNQ